jgi:hypothetical protein
MRRFTGSGYATFFSFIFVLGLAEAFTRMFAPSLPANPGEWPRTEMAQKLDQMRNYDNAGHRFDVVFVGSSMTADGINPNDFSKASGKEGYNSAFAGPSVRTIAPWTLNVADPLLHPKAVVIGVQSRELNDNGAKNIRMYQSFLASPGYKQFRSTTGVLERHLENLSDFLKYRRLFRKPDELLHTTSNPFAGVHLRQQIGPRGVRIEPNVNYRNTKKFSQHLYEETLSNFHVGGPEYHALVAFAHHLKSQGIKLIVMTMPVTPAYWQAHKHPVEDKAAFHRVIHKFARTSGVTMINAEKAFPDHLPFREPMHLDVEGAAALSKGLGDAWSTIMSSGSGWLRVHCTAGDAPTCSVTHPKG